MPKQRKWPPEETALLSELATQFSIPEIALILNRDRESVRQKIRREKIPFKRLVKPHEKRTWTEKEENLLDRWAGEVPYPMIAQKLKRSNQSIIWKAQELGLSLVTELDGWSSSEFAELTGVPHPTIRYWIKKDWLKAEKLDWYVNGRHIINRKNFTDFYLIYHQTLPSLQKISPEILDWILIKKRG